MSDKTVNGLVQTWVPVTDELGRVHMEAHWVTTTSMPAAAHAA
ncbi:hypothetical protein [Nocardioides mangrovi]|nr:hypothetical protein [Nocardioides mangrovi]